MILVTGGAGYIGSHTCIELLLAGYDLLVLDNLNNSSTESLFRVGSIVGVGVSSFTPCKTGFAEQDNPKERLVLIEGDVRERALLREIFSHYRIDAVVHFAGLKSVGESVRKPLLYYDNNVSGSVALLEVMQEFGCKRLVFSSSATVYGDPKSVPIAENFPLSTTNPYGASKHIVENILRDVVESDDSWSVGLMRYFNPVGAHESGLIGEDPSGVPNNLMPFVSQVAVGIRKKLLVFGGDYPTLDGTGVRDYIHVVDLAKGHLAALQKLLVQKGLLTINLGTGRGYSVLELVKAFEAASEKSIPYEIVNRRVGDVAQCYADPNYAYEVLGWKAELDIHRMCEDSWRWQSRNPNGYKK